MFSFRILWCIESSKEGHLFKIEIFCHIKNVFTVTFDKFNASLQNKCINCVFIIVLTINVWMVVYHGFQFKIVIIFHNITVFTVFVIN